MPNHPTSASRRDPAVDIARGLGILCVVWGHTGSPLGHYMIYMFHMPLFFFISGYLHSDHLSPAAWVRHKAKSLLLPYVLFMLAETALGRFLFPESYLQDSPWLPSGITGPLWFLLSLFTVSAAYRSLRLLRLPPWGELGASALLTSAGWWFSRTGTHLPLFLGSSLSLFLFYALGSHSRAAVQVLGKRPWTAAMAGAVLLFLLYKVDFQLLRLNTNDLIVNVVMSSLPLYLISALAGIAMTWAAATALAPSGLAAWLALLGRKSLHIFATHLAVLKLMELHWPGQSPAADLLRLAVSVGAGLAVSLLPAALKGLNVYRKEKAV